MAGHAVTTPPTGTLACRRSNLDDPTEAAFQHDLFVSDRAETFGLGPDSGPRWQALLEMQYHGFRSSLSVEGLEHQTWWSGAEPVARLVLAHTPDTVHVQWVAVAPEHRSRGVGRAVLGPVLDRAEAEGRDVTLRVDPHNAPALALYRHLGFVVDATGPADPGDSDPALFLRRSTRSAR